MEGRKMMTKTPQFTVLMSVYEKEKPEYLRACLESMKNQSLLADEWLIICDGPLTRELDQELACFYDQFPDRTRIQRFKENRGLGEALADGVKLAKYEYIARMDTDDIARPDRFEKQLNYLSEHKEVDILGSNITEFDQDPKEIKAIRSVPETHEEIYEYAKRRNPFNHMTVVYKKSVVLKAGNYQALKGYEDYYLWVRMLKKGAIAANLKENLVNARANAEMYKRRGGLSYFLASQKAYQTIYKVGLASPKDKWIRELAQLLVNLSPGWLRAKLYDTLLRKKRK
ncbi:glycosyltransferase [Atopobacter sp. AH10]|uniref:glycosyltransferase n=1 Tax=Atopobacter sp. AH10 TaxID=2315861 RepID=UPI001F424168|nr:glycosyltransferase [Atopobacter sp. AH10]